MKGILLLFLIACSASASLPNPLYFSASGSGSQSGADAADAIPESFVDSQANWGSGPSQINPGTTITAVGTCYGISLYSAITLSIPGGAGITQPYPPCVSLYPGIGGVVIDGTGGGFISCNNNGSLLANQRAGWAVNCTGAVGNLTVQNISISNIYVHTLASDNAPGADQCGGINVNGMTGTVTCSGILFSNNGTDILCAGNGTLLVTNCVHQNFNHGVYPPGNSGASWSVQSNYFGSAANWSTSNGTFHQDGIIWGGTTPSTVINSLVVSGNVFAGPFGAESTAYVFFFQGGASTASMFNNVFIVAPGDYLNDGCFTAGVLSLFANNTLINNGPPQTAFTQGNGCVDVNNLFVGFGTFQALNGSGFNVNNNLYVNPQPWGNPPWNFGGNGISTFASLVATSGEANSQYVTGMNLATVLNTNTGALVSGSPAIGTGANLYNLFQADIIGAARPSVGAWSVGAFCVNVTGSLEVQISPASAVAAGAEWQIDGGAFETNGAIVTNIPVGQHVVGFSPLAGWMTPSNQLATITSNSLTTVSATYTNVPGTGGLIVTILPAAAVSAGAQWQTNGGPFLPSGSVLTTVPSSGCTVSFSTNVANWTPPPPEIMAVTPGQFTQVTNYYTAYGLHVVFPTLNVLNGLVAWWTLDDLSGTDSSGNGNTLTFTGGPLSASGEITNGIAFNGTSQSAVTPIANLSFSSGAVTWWQNPATPYNSGSVRGLWGQLAGGSGTPEFSCQVYNDNNWYVGWHTSGNDARVVVPATAGNYVQGSWNFYALTWSPSGTGLSLNGVQIGTNSAPPSVSNIGSAFCFGKQGAAISSYFPGSIDDVRIYNRALSASEIAGQYQWPTGGRP